jgi:ankyrin repeat protein/serine/threonine protein kinase
LSKTIENTETLKYENTETQNIAKQRFLFFFCFVWILCDDLKMSSEIVEWFWSCIKSGDTGALLGFFEHRTININSTVDPDGLNALHHASKEGFVDIIKILIEKKADVDFPSKSKNWTALHYASHYNRVEVADFLISSGASIDSVNSERKTPAEVAGNFETKSFLLNFQIQLSIKNLLIEMCHEPSFHKSKWEKFVRDNPSFSLDTKLNKDGWSALFMVAFSGKLEAVSFLVENRANLEHLDKDKRTALHWACCSNNYSVVEYLIDEKANINVQDKNGRTPLLQAIADKNLFLIDILLEAGSDLSIRDKWGQSATESTENVEIIERIQRFTTSRKKSSFLLATVSNDHSSPHEKLRKQSLEMEPISTGRASQDELRRRTVVHPSQVSPRATNLDRRQSKIEIQAKELEIHRQEEELEKLKTEMTTHNEVVNSNLIHLFRENFPSSSYRIYDLPIYKRFPSLNDYFFAVSTFDSAGKMKFIMRTIKDLQNPVKGQYNIDLIEEHQMAMVVFFNELAPEPEKKSPDFPPIIQTAEPPFVPRPTEPTVLNNSVTLASSLKNSLSSSDRAVIVPGSMSKLKNGRVTKTDVILKIGRGKDGAWRCQNEADILLEILNSNVSPLPFIVRCEGVFKPSEIITSDGYVLSSLPANTLDSYTGGMALEKGLQNLETYVQSERTTSGLSFLRLAELTLQIANVVNYIHMAGWIWVDLKPTNFVLFSYVNKLVWKAIDFESAVKQTDTSYPDEMSFTPTYVAPELARAIRDNSALAPDTKVDSWSLGLLLLWLFKDHGQDPLSQLKLKGSDAEILNILADHKNLQLKIEEIIESSFPDTSHEGIKHVILGLLTVNQDHRITVDAALNRQFLKSGGATIKKENVAEELRRTVQEVNNKMDNMLEIGHQIRRDITKLSDHIDKQFQACQRNLSSALDDMGKQSLQSQRELSGSMYNLQQSMVVLRQQVTTSNSDQFPQLFNNMKSYMTEFIGKSMDLYSKKNDLNLMKAMSAHKENMEHYFTEVSLKLDGIDLKQDDNKVLLQKTLEGMSELEGQLNTVQDSLEIINNKCNSIQAISNLILVEVVEGREEFNQALEEMGDALKSRTKTLENLINSKAENMEGRVTSELEKLSNKMSGIFRDISGDLESKLVLCVEQERKEVKRSFSVIQDYVAKRMCDMSDLIKSENSSKYSLVLEGMKSIRDQVKETHDNVLVNRELLSQGFEKMGEYARKEQKMLQSLLLNKYDMPNLFIMVPPPPKNTVLSKLNPKNWFYNKCRIYYVCPVTLKTAPSGKDGLGYEVTVAKDFMKYVAPALIGGLIVLKISMTLFGLPLPLPIPDFSVEINKLDFLNSFMKNVGDQVEGGNTFLQF